MTQAPNSTGGQDERGLKCLRCGGHEFRVTHTYRTKCGRIRRRRVCTNPKCKRPLYTWEQTSFSAGKPRPDDQDVA